MCFLNTCVFLSVNSLIFVVVVTHLVSQVPPGHPVLLRAGAGLVASYPGVVLHLVLNGYFMAVLHPVLHPVLQGDAVYPPGCSADGGAPWPGGAHALVILCNILIVMCYVQPDSVTP